MHGSNIYGKVTNGHDVECKVTQGDLILFFPTFPNIILNLNGPRGQVRLGLTFSIIFIA